MRALVDSLDALVAAAKPGGPAASSSLPTLAKPASLADLGAPVRSDVLSAGLCDNGAALNFSGLLVNLFCGSLAFSLAALLGS